VQEFEMKYKLCCLVCALTAALLFLGGCGMDSNEKFIQGTWYFDHTEMRLAIDHQPWLDEVYWTFDNGTYDFYQCCNHLGQEQGRYRVIESKGNVLLIELLNSDWGELRLVIDREADTLVIQNGRPFVRVLP
jgi:hypothetical protein